MQRNNLANPLGKRGVVMPTPSSRKRGLYFSSGVAIGWEKKNCIWVMSIV
jgi:hypothetical protein